MLRRRWAKQVAFLVAWLGAAALLGLLFGAPAWWLTAALLLYVAHTLRYIYLLDRMLDGGKRHAPFATRGLWAEILARVDTIKTKSRNRKKKFHRVLREIRESTGALSDGGVILNGDNEIVWFNPAATLLLGLDPRTDIGRRLDNLIRHPEFVSYLAEPGGEGITFPSPKMESAWLALQIIPYGRDQRIAIVRNVTREVNLERTRRDFVANASHELRSPLTVLSGYLDTFADDEDLPNRWKVPIAEMLRQSNRMTQILRDLMELMRLESAESDASRDFVDVCTMLGLMVRDFDSATEEHPAVSLHLETDAALLGNETELHSIFFNLIHNAVRFTPATGSVAVIWRTDDQGAAFEVTDTGIGIPEEEIPRITERFYRVDPGRSRAIGGTGLGLAIVKHAVQRHDGVLEIASVEGEGSTFLCRFAAERLLYRGGQAEAAV